MQLDRIAPGRARQIREYNQIIGFRHVIVHGYDSLDPATVWDVIEAKLPVLRDELRALLPDTPD